MAYTATHRHARISATKVRPIADLIRGKRVDDALAILRFQPQRGARMLEKVLKSALGNAPPRPPFSRGASLCQHLTLTTLMLRLLTPAGAAFLSRPVFPLVCLPHRPGPIRPPPASGACL